MVIKSNTPPAVVPPTFTVGQGEFIDFLKIKEMSMETIRGYEVDLNQFRQYLSKETNAPVFVDEITTEDLEEYQQSMQQRGLKPASINRKMNAVSSFFNYAVRKKWIGLNPAQYVERVKGKSAERCFLNAKEIQQIVEAMEHPIIKHLVIMMANTGLRVSECTNLTLHDVDFDEKVVRVIEGKGKKDRTVPMNDSLVQVMRAYLKKIRPKTNSLNFFATKKTGAISQQYVNRVLKQTCQKVGIQKDVTSHVLRHSFASQLVKTDTHVAIIQRLLGHADVRTTSVYLHANQSDLKQAVNSIGFLDNE
ncbi:tyrosine-type recombinase/integrase [Sporosarcina sp. P33]|uniref:tyrosine-type recombinase/integrase n=1 Tax=Sporosarcina sp. P33 TaxID=1930764 RepID=UPI0009BD997C|nr:tyrosine-type recombinase/integrase [Sporosarcina sp. P33]ARD48845.1 hypothetical protein SporoP33_11825 [Sporosarcina sp. P33]